MLLLYVVIYMSLSEEKKINFRVLAFLGQDYNKKKYVQFLFFRFLSLAATGHTVVI